MKKMFKKVEEVALAQIAQRLKDNKMAKKMSQWKEVALAWIAQRLESNFVPAAIPPSIVDR